MKYASGFLLLLFTLTVQAQTFSLDRSGQHTATGSALVVLSLPAAIGTLRVVGRSPAGDNYTTGEYRVVNAGWNYPSEASITSVITPVVRGAGVGLVVGHSDGGRGDMNVLITATAGSLIYWAFEGTAEPYAKLNTLKVGDYYQGGIIGYILRSGDPGYDAAMPHGLIVAPFDQGSSVPWIGAGNADNMSSGTYNGTSFFDLMKTPTSEIGAGRAVSAAIVRTLGDGTYAAKVCEDLYLNGFGDWYLPNLGEFMAVAKTIGVGSPLGNVGSFSTTTGQAQVGYWTSSEKRDGIDPNLVNAVSYMFLSGGADALGQDWEKDRRKGKRVRAMRSF